MWNVDNEDIPNETKIECIYPVEEEPMVISDDSSTESELSSDDDTLS